MIILVSIAVASLCGQNPLSVQPPGRCGGCTIAVTRAPLWESAPGQRSAQDTRLPILRKGISVASPSLASGWRAAKIKGSEDAFRAPRVPRSPKRAPHSLWTKWGLTCCPLIGQLRCRRAALWLQQGITITNDPAASIKRTAASSPILQEVRRGCRRLRKSFANAEHRGSLDTHHGSHLAAIGRGGLPQLRQSVACRTVPSGRIHARSETFAPGAAWHGAPCAGPPCSVVADLTNPRRPDRSLTEHGGARSPSRLHDEYA